MIVVVFFIRAFTPLVDAVYWCALRLGFREDTARMFGEMACTAIPMAFFVGLPLLVLSLLSGCGASALRLHAEAADALGTALDVAGDELVEHRNADVLIAAHAGTTRAEAEAAMDAARAHWLPAIAAEESVAAAQRAYADAVVELAAERTTEAHLLALLVPLARAYQALAAALEPVGVHLPALPAWAAQALGQEGATP